MCQPPTKPDSSPSKSSILAFGVKTICFCPCLLNGCVDDIPLGQSRAKRQFHTSVTPLLGTLYYIAMPRSRDDDKVMEESAPKAPAPSSDEVKRVQILAELSSVVNTLSSIQQVLQDMEHLTSVSLHGSNLHSRQQELLQELAKWKNLHLQPPAPPLPNLEPQN